MKEKELSPRKLIILDIDECLIHATEHPLEGDYDFESDWCYVYKRPYVDEFIAFCFEHFDVALWTTAGSLHADLIVDQLFDRDERLVFVWSFLQCTRRYDCEEFREYFIKNFNKLKRKGFDLTQIIMVDDTPEKHIRNYGNLVRVNAFEGCQKDDELLRLMDYLLTLKNIDNIRSVEKRHWRNG